MISSLIGIIASSGGVAGTAYESIATTTVGSGGVASITFSSIPSTYTHLQIRGIARNTDTGGSNIGNAIRLNSDTGSNYATHYLFGDGSSAFSQVTAPNSFIALGDMPTSGMLASTFSTYVVDILDYTNTNKNKTLRTLSGFDRNGAGWIGLSSGVWINTTAVNAVTVIPYGGNFAQYSSFALYGIKG
jgi:hypothetical protein